MTTMNVDQVLAQIRSMSSEASQGVKPPVEAESQVNFSDVLKNSINHVNEAQQEAGVLKTAFIRGDDNVDITRVMISAQKASVEFQAMTQVRNKLVDAYKDIMNMPI